MALNSFSAVLGTVFFFRVGLDRDSIFTGLHGIFWAGLGTHGTPHRRTGLSTSGDSMAFLGGTRYPRDNTGPGSILMGVHGRFYAGFSNHGTPIVLSTTVLLFKKWQQEQYRHLRSHTVDMIRHKGNTQPKKMEYVVYQVCSNGYGEQS